MLATHAGIWCSAACLFVAFSPHELFVSRLGVPAPQAYNDIESEDGSPSMKMTSLGGTEITFVDK